jgi:hypothetical protein
MTLVDTNVVIDVLTYDAVWLGWSMDQLEKCRQSETLHINEIGYAELSARLDSEAILQAALAELGIALERMPTSALFAAGQAFRRYRSAGGARLNILADFFIGAHAQTARFPILTRDVRVFRSYFPEVRLIAP